MKRLILPILGTSLLACALAAQAAPMSLKTTQDKLSYSMGVMTGRAFKSHNIKVNPAAFAQGLSDGATGHKTLMPEAQIQSTLANFQKAQMKKLAAKMKKEAAENLQKGKKFLAKNKNKPGVVTLKSGLQYKVLRAGKGMNPSRDDTVTVNYEGRLLNGKVFDSSYKRGKPATFPVKSVIKGWQQALMKMKPGAIWEIYIPSNLAYGKMGAPGVIGPNETLIFKVDLISVKNK